jgi:hypothetical protein
MEQAQGQDLYEVLQVSPQAHPLIITKAFRLLAALYHPDNTETGDQEAFKQLAHAYRILSDPVRRAAYDREHRGAPGSRIADPIDGGESLHTTESRDWDEQELRSQILRALYDVRRSRPYQPGLSLMVLSELLGCSIESLQYTLWYLRGKRYIDTTNDSDLVITVDGVDALEANGCGENRLRPSARNGRPLAIAAVDAVQDDVTLEPSWTVLGKRNGNGFHHQD